MSENRGLNLPGQQQRIPGIPEDANIIAFEQFNGLNTKSPRVAIQASECAWLDGFMPVTDNNLRTLYGPSPPIYTATDVGIVYVNAYNLGDVNYFFVLQSDGSAIQVNASNGATTPIAIPGSFATETDKIATTGWGGQYLLIVASQGAQYNGYFIWDGTSLYQAGTIGPIIDITNGGVGYTVAPAVSFHTSGLGSGLVLTAQVSNGSVITVSVVNPGSGFNLGDPIVITFNGGNGTQTAYGVASFNNGVITNATVTSPGQGYQSSVGVQIPPTITITDSTGSGGSIVASEMGGGQLIAVQLVAGGINYTNPTITLTGPAGSSGASVGVTLGSGVITGTAISQPGLGYTGDTTVKFINQTGIGAQANAILDPSTGSVTAIQITNGGSGYSGNVLFEVDGPGPASATAELMPFGVNGTAIEVFQSRVWIANGASAQNQNRVIFSAADDPADFSPADGAGAFPSTDSFLRVGYHGLKQTNGFLYLIGDSSENTISGVQTTSPSTSSATSQVITTFNNQNSDPQLGSPWPASIQVFSRNIIFANKYGILQSVGGAVVKISQALDGFYAGNLSNAPSTNYPSALATIFGNQVYMILIPVFDPFANAVVNKLAMWDGKKFWTYPAASLTYICAQEINSFQNAWATDGASLFQLFTTPSNAVQKIARTKLWIDPSYWTTKTAIRLSSVIQPYNADESIIVAVDSDITSSSAVTIPITTTDPHPMVSGPLPCGQNGRALGMTLLTNCSDISLVSLSMLTQIFSTNI